MRVVRNRMSGNVAQNANIGCGHQYGSTATTHAADDSSGERLEGANATRNPNRSSIAEV